MGLKIGSQPVSCDGKEALQAVASGLAKSASRPIDPSTLQIRIRSGETVYELKAGDVLELSANVAAPKSAKKADKPAPAKKADPKQTTIPAA